MPQQHTNSAALSPPDATAALSSLSSPLLSSPLLSEKAFVTGVEAANAVVKQLGVGKASTIIPLEDDEPHIQALRAVNGRAKQVVKALPGSGWLLP